MKKSQCLALVCIGLLSVTTSNAAKAQVEPDYKAGPMATTKVYATQGAAERQADMDFVKGMRPHHAGALTMSEQYLSSNNASNAKLKALAGGIIRNQTFEIGILDRVEQLVSPEIAPDTPITRQVAEQGLAQKQRFVRAPMPTSFGMGDTPVTKRDVEFAKAMVVHHEGALVMAKDYLANPAAKNPYLRQMCLDILRDQKMEIAYMNKLITYYPGNPDDVKIDPSMVHGMDGMMHHGKKGVCTEPKKCKCMDKKKHDDHGGSPHKKYEKMDAAPMKHDMGGHSMSH